MFGLDNAIGAGIGALSGATSSAGYRGHAFEPMLDDEERGDYAHSGMSRLEDWSSGSQPMVSQATINRLLSGSMGRLDAEADASRTRATEQSIQYGEGPRGGMRRKQLGKIDRNLLDAKRQTQAPILGQLAMAQPEFQMRAQGMMLPFLSDAERMAYSDHIRMEDLRAARAAQGNQFHRALAGAAAGWSGAGSFDSWVPQAGGSSAAAAPSGSGSHPMTWSGLPWDQDASYYNIDLEAA